MKKKKIYKKYTQGLALALTSFTLVITGCDGPYSPEEDPYPYHEPGPEPESYIYEDELIPPLPEPEVIPLPENIPPEVLRLSGNLEDGVRVVEITARQFEFAPSRIVVRHGETVRFEITSQDVMHGFGIATLEIEETLPPHETVTIEFTADDPGIHHFHCTVYCGEGHDQMYGEILVLELED